MGNAPESLESFMNGIEPFDLTTLLSRLRTWIELAILPNEKTSTGDTRSFALGLRTDELEPNRRNLILDTLRRKSHDMSLDAFSRERWITGDSGGRQ